MEISLKEKAKAHLDDGYSISETIDYLQSEGFDETKIIQVIESFQVNYKSKIGEKKSVLNIKDSPQEFIVKQKKKQAFYF